MINLNRRQPNLQQSQLRECLREQAAVHSVGAVAAALADVAHVNPETAESILAYALDLRRLGLLQDCQPERAAALLSSLEAVLGHERTAKLRNSLIFDRVLGPLAPS